MKLHLILPLITCVVLSPALHAQSTTAPATSGTCPQYEPGNEGPRGHHRGRGHGENLKHLTTALNLTPSEQASIKPILEALHTQVKAIHEDKSLTKEQKMAKSRDAREAANGQINGLLTPAQQQQFAALKDGHYHGHHGGEAPSANATATP